jgi:hypothetical protein
MSDFKSSLTLIDNGNGTFNLNFTIYSPGAKYSINSSTQAFFVKYNATTRDLPGVQLEIKLNYDGAGNPDTFSGSIPITSQNVITFLKPFVDVRYLAWDPAIQAYRERGGAIVRSQVPA